MSIGNGFNSFNMEQYLQSIYYNNKNAQEQESTPVLDEDGNEIKSQEPQQTFDFKSAFEYYNDTENKIDEDTISVVIPKLLSALEKDTIKNIDSFVNNLDLSSLSVNQESVKAGLK